MVTRRRFLAAASLSSLAYAVAHGDDEAESAPAMHVGYAAITWGANITQAIERAQNELEPLPEVQELIRFVEASERGVVI